MLKRNKRDSDLKDRFGYISIYCMVGSRDIVMS